MPRTYRNGIRATSRGVCVAAVLRFWLACSSADNGTDVPSFTGGNSPIASVGGTATRESGGANAQLSGVATMGGAAGRGSGSGVTTGGSFGGNTATSVNTASGGVSMGGNSTTSGGVAGGGISTGGSLIAGGGATAGATATVCPQRGHIEYTLTKDSAPTTEQQTAYDKITRAMDEAVYYYNCYTSIAKTLNVSFVPSVTTADGNINGSIRFGSTASMNRVTAMHEISHTVGIGTAPKWSSLVTNGKFSGKNALVQLLAIPNRLADDIGADKSHFWPYGLNYESEGKNDADLIAHCQMVTAIRKDLELD